MTQRAVISACVWGLIWPAVLVGIFVAIDYFRPEMKIRPSVVEYPWRGIFAVGILIAVWGQTAASEFFYRKHYYKSTFVISEGFQENWERFAIPIGIMIFPFFAILTIKTFVTHMAFTVAYAGFVSVIDLMYYRNARPVANTTDAQKATVEFRTRCRQLLFHIDGASLLAFVIWSVILCFVELGCPEFAFANEVEEVVTSSELPDEEFKKAFKHPIAEPIMSGIVGFHLVLTFFLLVVHMAEWEYEAQPQVSSDAFGNGKSDGDGAQS